MALSTVDIIPLVDLTTQQRDIAAEIAAPMERVLLSGEFIGGPEVAEFEQAYAAWLGADYCVGVANGTDALELALRACGVRAGDEVILPANTFIATAEAVARIGAQVVLVDVDPDQLLIDPELVRAAITDRTRAIMPVHLYGQVAPVERLIDIAASAGAAIVEDAAQAHGATRYGQKAGTLGTAAGTSFYPGKNLGAGGDAGAVITDDAGIADTVRMLGAHGSRFKYEHEVIGMNSRLDTIQAVILSAKLRRLSVWNQQRTVAAELYSRWLDGSGIITPRSAVGNVDAWHLYVVRVAERDRVLRQLNAAGVGAGIHYPTPLHLTSAFASARYPRGSFPVAERAAGEILSLPIYPHITPDQQDRVVVALMDAMRGAA
ncbi:MAG TPA: DegT/DnrJ/EryC1/StrS family aminotransferase [Homoserinimonas sp.]|nr:DegT/DnrJ/EryC1/StrS family aminotransferase [Homoserinimonas sp.]